METGVCWAHHAETHPDTWSRKNALKMLQCMSCNLEVLTCTHTHTHVRYAANVEVGFPSSEANNIRKPSEIYILLQYCNYAIRIHLSYMKKVHTSSYDPFGGLHSHVQPKSKMPKPVNPKMPAAKELKPTTAAWKTSLNHWTCRVSISTLKDSKLQMPRQTFEFTSSVAKQP